MAVSNQGGIEFYASGASHGPNDEVIQVGVDHDGIGYNTAPRNTHGEINLGDLSTNQLYEVEAGLREEFQRFLNRLSNVSQEELIRLANIIQRYSDLFEEATKRIPEPDSLIDSKAVPSDDKVYSS